MASVPTAVRPAGLAPPPERHAADALVEFARRLLEAAGLDVLLVEDTAEVLVEGDLLGRDTHGLALLPAWLGELERGAMTASGVHAVLSERTVAAVWDGRRLPGPPLVRRAIDWAASRARAHGSATVAIRRAHQPGCLAAYLEAPARAGLVVELMASDPAVATVAPHGGTQAVLTPNPLAIGIPTSGEPLLVDLATSETTPAAGHRLRTDRRRAAHPAWLDALGQPTDDPATMWARPPGAILPLGGLATGHKGTALALAVEAMTGGLAGFGRADVPEGWGATLCVRVTDPEAFAGAAAFTWQTDWVAQACRASAPRDPSRPVRLPGERALEAKREQRANGVALHPSILPALATWARRFGVPLPRPAD